MRNFQGERETKNIFYSWPALGLFGLLLIFFALIVLRFLVKMGETSRNREIAETKIIELQKTKEKLSNDIENLKTEKGIEENIRERFGLAKEGEALIIVVEDKEALNLNNETRQNWFQRFFGNWFK